MMTAIVEPPNRPLGLLAVLLPDEKWLDEVLQS